MAGFYLFARCKSTAVWSVFFCLLGLCVQTCVVVFFLFFRCESIAVCGGVLFVC